jgi:hypothetical protein
MVANPMYELRPRDVLPSYPTVSLTSFVSEPEPEFPMLVGGIGLAAVGTFMLGGPPKSLKTLLMTQLAVCASTCDDDGDWLPFLDFPIERGGPVLFVEEEGGRAPLRRRLERQRAALGADPAIEFLLFAGVRLDNDSSFRRLRATVDTIGPALVVLDPFSFLHGQDENKPAAMAPIMKRLSALATDGETCVVVIHHVSKPQADRPAGRLGDRIRGASSITAGIDGFLLLDRKGNDRAQLRGEFRDQEPIDLTVELDPETLLLHRVDSPMVERKVADDELRVFVTEQGRVTRRDVAMQFGLRSKNTAGALLEALPEIDWYDDGSGRRTRYYRMRTGQ